MLWLKLLHFDQLVCIAMATKCVYVAVYLKPYGAVMEPPFSIECSVALLLYKGTFTTQEFAERIVPLARGEMVNFPEGSLSEPSFVWHGNVTIALIKVCLCVCVFRSCCEFVCQCCVSCFLRLFFECCQRRPICTLWESHQHILLAISVTVVTHARLDTHTRCTCMLATCAC